MKEAGGPGAASPIRVGFIAAAVAGLILGCGRETPEPVTVDIGVHRVSLIIPEGWQHYGHGREHRLEAGEGDIVLTDLGPVAAEGYTAVLLEARELARRGKSEDAKRVLGDLGVRPGVDDAGVGAAIDSCLDSVRTDRPAAQVEASFAAALERAGRLADPDLDWLARRQLVELDHGPRRDIEREERLGVGGRDAWRILTWQRLTHESRRRHVFALNRGNLLVIRTEMGVDAVLGPAFDTVVRSLVFVEGDPQRPR